MFVCTLCRLLYQHTLASVQPIRGRETSLGGALRVSFYMYVCSFYSTFRLYENMGQSYLSIY